MESEETVFDRNYKNYLAQLKNIPIKLIAPNLDVNYDFAMQFDALPRVPVLLLFNDADEEFSAKCSVLFERRAEKYLDAECIAMLGWQLFNHLRKTNRMQ